jgi:glycosyltransferase involved in cell wall biosynthesis
MEPRVPGTACAAPLDRSRIELAPQAGFGYPDRKSQPIRKTESDVTPLRTAQEHLRIAVLIPCYNEEVSIGSVVQSFKAEMPDAVVYVYDNNSTDRTTEVARAAGAVLRREPRQGKGNVIRCMFADIEADVYVLVDGDDTCDASAAPRLVQCLLADQLDFVNGARVSNALEAYRRGHRLGNRVLSKLVEVSFGRQFTDMLSGYKGAHNRTFGPIGIGYYGTGSIVSARRPPTRVILRKVGWP